MPFRIVYGRETEEHLISLTARQRATVIHAVDRQLGDQPVTPTRNRKPMRANPLASWELRIGNLRIYYDVDESEATVNIIAIGIKRRERVWIGGEEYKL